MNDPIYPHVRCTLHPSRPEVSGYVVCEHVAKRERPVAVYEPPTKKEMGVLVCQQCDEELAARTADHVALVCVYCVNEQNLIPN